MCRWGRWSDVRWLLCRSAYPALCMAEAVPTTAQKSSGSKPSRGRHRIAPWPEPGDVSLSDRTTGPVYSATHSTGSFTETGSGIRISDHGRFDKGS
jgi:hypothetical protein